ncbi:MAG: SsrA-binding protein [Parcubacteria group bacterium GW2011_GWC2_44_22]|nr:MAG: SsrA-binding protein [Parcubacteria group bacterium GW2011_GWC2_44_22]
MEIKNKYSSRDYELKDVFSAGIVLSGPEVKACKKGSINFKGAYCIFGVEELLMARVSKEKQPSHQQLASFQESRRTSPLVFVLKNFYISPYIPARREQKSYDAYRPRRLLLSKRELNYLFGKSKERGVTIIPTRIYTKKRLVKLDIAIAQGLKKYDNVKKLKRKSLKGKKSRF